MRGLGFLVPFAYSPDSTNQERPWRTSSTEVSVPQGFCRVITRGPRIHTCSNLWAREMMLLGCVYNYFPYICRCHHDQKEKLYRIRVRLLLLIQRLPVEKPGPVRAPYLQRKKLRLRGGGKRFA